jgi:SAM-dependent methyltransferase
MNTTPETDTTRSVFDGFVDEYEEACARGVQLSGENRAYFATERVRLTAASCSTRLAVQRIVDFGCGLGHSTPHLLAAFPDASVVGVDTSARTIDSARQRYGSQRSEFTADAGAVSSHSVQLVYSNGTFHHIEPQDRLQQMKTIWNYLESGGLFALWENNPWNPGTRMVMSRIPFDRDAKPLSFVESRRLLKQGGFDVVATSFHFYFPSALKALRRFEPFLEGLPLGAQYCVLAQRPV